MRIQRFITVAIAALALSATACGKDDKAAKSGEKPAAGDKKAAEKSDGNKDEAKTGEAAKKPAEANKDEAKKPAEAKAGAPAAAEAKASDKKAAATDPPAAKKAAATEPAVKGATPPAPAAAPATGPAAALVMAGTPSLDAVLNTVKALAETAGAGAMVAGDTKKRALDGLKMAMEVTDASWLDTAKPIRLAVMDPKRYGQNGAAVVLPITAKDKVLASLKADAKKGHEGHAAYFELRGMPTYLDFVDGHVVMTSNAEVFGRAKAAITDKLVKWTPTKPLEVQLDMNAVNTLYAQDLKRAQAMAKELYGQMAKIQGQGNLGDLAGANLDMLFGFVESASMIGMRLDAKNGHLLTDLVVKGKSGTGIEQFANAMKGQTSSLVASVPKGAWFSMASNIDGRKIPALKELQGIAIRSYVQMLNIKDEGKVKKIDAVLEKLWQLTEGDGAASIGMDGTFPMAFQYVATMTDAKKAQAAYHELTGMVIEILLEQAAAAGQKLPIKKDMGLVNIIQAMGKMTGQMGVKLAASSGPAGGANLDVMELEVDWAKLPPAMAQQDNIKMVKAVLGSKLQFAFAYAGKNMAMAIGPNGKTIAPKLASGKFDGGSPELVKANTGNAMAVVVKVGQLIQAFEKISPGLSDKADAIAKLTKAQPVVMTGKEESGQMVFTLDLPLATVVQLIGAFR